MVGVEVPTTLKINPTPPPFVLYVTWQIGAEENIPAFNVSAQAPLDILPTDETHVPFCFVIADPASQLISAVSNPITAADFVTTLLAIIGAGND